MNRKEFKRRLLNYYVHPEMFLLPCKKEEKEPDIKPIILDVYIGANALTVNSPIFYVSSVYNIYQSIYFYNLNAQKAMFANYKNTYTLSYQTSWMPEYNSQESFLPNFVNEYVKKSQSYNKPNSISQNSLVIPLGYCPGFYTYDKESKKYTRVAKAIEESLITDNVIPEYKDGLLYKMSKYSFFDSDDIYLKIEFSNGKSFELKSSDYNSYYNNITIQGTQYYVKQNDLYSGNLTDLYFSNIFDEAGTYRIKIYCKNISTLYFQSDSNYKYITKVVDWGNPNLKTLYNFLRYSKIDDDLPEAPEWFKNILYTNNMFDNSTIKTIPNLNFQKVISCEYFAQSSQIEEVDDNLFSNCPWLISVKYAFYNSKVKKVGRNVMSNCSNLINLEQIFSGCTSLEEIGDNFLSNSNNITSVNYAFQNCNLLTKVPDNLFNNKTELIDAAYLFYGCKKLQTLPKNLFKNCKRLIKLCYTFYDCDSLTSIDSDVFSGCTNLRTFSFFFYTYNASKSVSIGDKIFYDITNSKEAINAGVPSVIYLNYPFYLSTNKPYENTQTKDEAIQKIKDSCLHLGTDMFNYSIFNDGMYIYLGSFYFNSYSQGYTNEFSSISYVYAYGATGEAPKFYNHTDKICYNFDITNNTGENYLVFSESNTSLNGSKRNIYGYERGERKVRFDGNYMPLAEEKCYDYIYCNFFDNYDEIPKENIGKIAPFETVEEALGDYWLYPFYLREIWFAARVPCYRYSYINGLQDDGGNSPYTISRITTPYKYSYEKKIPSFDGLAEYYIKNVPVCYSRGLYYKINVDNPPILSLAYAVGCRAPDEITLTNIRESMLESAINSTGIYNYFSPKCYSERIVPIAPMVKCQVENLTSELSKTFEDGSIALFTIFYNITDRTIKHTGIHTIELIDAVTNETLSTITGIKSKLSDNFTYHGENEVLELVTREGAERWENHSLGDTYTNAVPYRADWNDRQSYPDGFVLTVEGNRTSNYYQEHKEYGSKINQTWTTTYEPEYYPAATNCIRYNTNLTTFNGSGDIKFTWSYSSGTNNSPNINNLATNNYMMCYFFGTNNAKYDSYTNEDGEKIKYSSLEEAYSPPTYNRIINNNIFLTKYLYSNVVKDGDYFRNTLYNPTTKLTIDSMTTATSNSLISGTEGQNVLLPTFDSNYTDFAKIMYIGVGITRIPMFMNQYQTTVENRGKPTDLYRPD